MDGSLQIEVALADGVADLSAAEWDACAAPERADGGRAANPFVTHAFLGALEESGSVQRRTGWIPQHLVARLGGEVIGAMPLYLKAHSQGEYVFDHAWANAFERAGGDYYPKLQSAVPFTPATGPRLLARPDAPIGQKTIRAALLRAATEVTDANELSSFHMTFCTEAEWQLGRELGLLGRTDQQFHWENAGYDRFDDFLGALASRKRKQLKKERAKAVENGIRIHQLSGADLREEHWHAFWVFYQDTGSRKWGRPYLWREFFNLIHQRMADDILLVMCERDGQWVAGALNLIGRETLYGRYWGCTEEHPFLHFETCYYQAIDAAIRLGLKRVEAGAQGGHKLARGYAPVTTRSLHYFPNAGMRDAIGRYLAAEREAVAEETAALAEMTPFRRP